MHGEGTEEACGMTARPDRSGVNIDALVGSIRRLATISAVQCPTAMVATSVKDHRNLLPAPVTAFAAFALMLVFDVLVQVFRMFADPRRVGGRVGRYRVNGASNDRLAVVGPEALQAVVFGKER